MFQRLKKLFRPRSSIRIFAYHDGSRWRSIDPVLAVQAIADHPTYSATRHPAEVAEGDAEAIRTTAAAVCDVFGVKPYDENTRDGLTTAEMVALLDAFDRYCYWVKKNTNHGPTPAPSMASIPSGSAGPTTSDT